MRNRRHRETQSPGVLLLGLFAFLLPWQSAFAQVDLRISLAPDRSHYQLGLRGTRDTSLCAFTLYGADSRSKLTGSMKKAAALGAFHGAPDSLWVHLPSAPVYRKTKKRESALKTIYFRAQLACGRQTSLSPIVTADARRESGGTIKDTATWFRTFAQGLGRSIALRSVRPNGSFTQPVDAQPTADGRLFIGELPGRIRNVADGSIILDITDRVRTDTGVGLLGFAFHPHHPVNPAVFVFYIERGTGNSIVARFLPDPLNTSVYDPASEQQILSLPPTQYNDHKGGQLAFHSDGTLYISLGDGGSAGDVLGNAQNSATLLGKILRINIDGAAPYSLPADNPFVGNTSGALEEIYALGFRNPWRMSFDRQTGLLWVGDVGQDSREEVDVVQAGGNYGWNRAEGTACYPPGSSCDPKGTFYPVHEYDHAAGLSVTGGYVTRDAAVPLLAGRYVFGDFVTGTIFQLDAAAPQFGSTAIFHTPLAISAFGADSSGRLYLLSFSEGTVYRFEGI